MTFSESRQGSSTDHRSCPSASELRHWLDGALELPDEVIQHLRLCSHCIHSLDSLTEDDQLKHLAQRSQRRSMKDYSEEPEFAHLRNSLKAFPLDLPSLPSPPSSTQGQELEWTDVEASSHGFLSAEQLGHQLPPRRYVVDRLIATGGSGAVYQAFDQSLQREVAIKVLASESMRNRQRFLREARLLAEFEHPNLVRVYDFGTLSDNERASNESQIGQLYLVMEYVPGGAASLLAVDQPCWAQGDMTFPRIAKMLATAADGLAAAHARNLVHRDVKPGNLLLVADRDSMKVADFGLARESNVEATKLTRTGDLLGTPVYMSPEQVTEGAIVTSSSDIYSLGATLYQLITGVAPFQGGATAVLRQIVESTPVAPRLINPLIPLDLQTICQRAMEQEPSARYASMQQFADDLRNFASGEPIHAKPISSTTKAIRYLRRNPTLSIAIAVCVGLACLLSVGSASAAIIFWNQNVKLQQAAAREKAAKQSAEDALKASITAADELLLAVTTETDLLPRAPGSQEVTRKLLERARNYFREFLDANQNNATLKYQLARAHAGLGSVAVRSGDGATLEKETETALSLIKKIPERELPPLIKAQFHCDTLIVLANHLTESGQAKRSLPMLEEAVAISKEALRNERGSAKASELDDLQVSHATALFGLANALHWLGKREDSLPHLLEAKGLFLQRLAKSPSKSTLLRSAAACSITLGTIALDLDRATESKGHFNDALTLLNQVQEEDSISLRIRELKIKVLTNLALAERRLGNNEESKAGYEATITEAKRLIELEPSVASHRWNLVVAAMNSGGPDLELGNLEALVERWQGTVPVLDKLISSDPSNKRYQQVKAMLQSNIAIVLRDMGKLDEAIAPLQAATETLRVQAELLDYASESYLPVALNHYELASTLIQLQRWQEALSSLDASDAIVEAILEKDREFTPARGHLLDSQHARIQLYLKQPEPDLDALQNLVEQSLMLARELAASNSDVAEFQLEIPRALNDYAQAQLAAGKFKEALDTVGESTRLLDAFNIPEDASSNANPEYRNGRKVSFLIEARALNRGSPEENSLDDATRTKVQSLLDRAKLFGATDEELSDQN